MNGIHFVRCFFRAKIKTKIKIVHKHFEDKSQVTLCNLSATKSQTRVPIFVLNSTTYVREQVDFSSPRSYCTLCLLILPKIGT